MSDLELLMSTLEEEGVQLWVQQGELRVRGTRAQVAPERLQQVREFKTQLLERLLAPSSAVDRVPRADRSQPIPLSYSQEALWLLDQLGAGEAYTLPYVVRVSGPLDVEILEQALNDVALRHEVLRTRFVQSEGRPLQQIDPPGGLRVMVEDVRQLPPGEHASLEQRWLDAECTYIFRIRDEAPVRVAVLRLSPEVNLLSINMHHIAVDAWSLRIFEHELAACYSARLLGAPNELPVQQIQPADHAIWQRRWLQGPALQQQLDFWREQLEGAPALLEMPLDRPRPAVQSRSGRSHCFDVPQPLVAGLRALSRRQGATLFMTVLAAWGALLSRVSGQQDVVIGTAVSNRPHEELQGLIGFLVNTLALRLRFAQDPRVADLVAQARETTLKAFAHQDLPFEHVVQALHPERSLSHSPVFQTMLALNNVSGEDDFRIPGLRFDAVALPQETTQFDLLMLLTETKDGLSAELTYGTELFEAATIERLAGCWLTLMEGMVADDTRRVSKLPLLDAANRDALLCGMNRTAMPVQGPSFIHELFEAQAATTPEAVAVAFGAVQLTYGQLNARANQLAHRLRALGVAPDDRVAICIERSVELVAALLGVLKAGGALVPMDPDYPAQRLDYTLQDAAPVALLTSERLAAAMAALPGAGALPRVLVDGPQAETLSMEAEANISASEVGLHSRHLAYVIYTSGSTGWPKGIAMAHDALRNLLAWQNVAPFGGRAPQRTLQFAALGFGVLYQEVFSSLLLGARVQLPSSEERMDMTRLLDLLQRERIERLFLPMVAFYRLAAAFAGSNVELPDLRYIAVAGEQLKIGADVRAMLTRLPNCRLNNHYGNSESHVVTAAPMSGPVDRWPDLPPIGWPVNNTRIYILDRHLEPVPLGVAGELHISGVQVARCYLNRPALSAERFIPDPFGGHGGRMYATGDLARWCADGQVEYLGRMDQQLKIRGFRIEPNEVESAIKACEGVADAAVIGLETGQGEKELVAYVTGSAVPTVEVLRQRLQQQLPIYMVPTAWVMLDRLPLNPNGKLDRKALPAPQRGRDHLGTQYVAPRNTTEQTVADIWRDVLNVTQVGIHDNFFMLGGHSLLATQALGRIREALKVELSLQQFFAAQSLQQLAEQANVAQTVEELSIPRRPRSGAIPASFAQQRLWFVDQYLPGTGVYNIPEAWRFLGPLNLEAMSFSLNEVLRRHDVLRTSFAVEDGVVVQRIAEHQDVLLSCVDLSAAEDRDARLLALMQREAALPFDLANGPIIRFAMAKLSDREHVLLLTIHHIASDGWSSSVLLRELWASYRSFANGLPSELPALPIQYSDYAWWQRDWLQGERLQRQLSYWEGYLHGAPELIELPLDKPRPSVLTQNGRSVSFELDKSLAQRVLTFSRERQVTVFMTMATAFGALLQRFSGQDDVCVGYPVANRHLPQIEDLIGFFVNMLVLRVRGDARQTFVALLEQVKESVLQAHANQDLPFERLVETLRPSRNPSHSPLFQVALSCVEAQAPDLRWPDGVEMQPVDAEFETFGAKFEMVLGLTVERGRIRGSLDYNTDLFEHATIERMVRHFVNLLDAAMRAPSQLLSRLSPLDDEDRRQLQYWNDTTHLLPEKYCLHQLIETQACDTPDAPAVEFEGEVLTYAALNERANRLAHELGVRGVGAEMLVGVCAERSLDMVVGLLGVLKAGGAYVPLDPELPAQRLQYMLHDCKASLLMVQRHLRDRVGDSTGLPDLVVLEDLIASSAGPGTNPEVPVGPENLAYTIYTSGSTGQPKGAMNRHAGIVNRLLWMKGTYPLCAGDRVLQKTPFSFDVSVWEFFWPLLTGATLVMLPPEGHKDPELLAEYIARRGITTLHFVPSMLQALLGSAGGFKTGKLRQVFCSGEALSSALQQQFHRKLPGVDLHNLYGPTEASVEVTHWTCSPENAGGPVPIGRPVWNTRIYVLDAEHGLLSPGIPGELYIAGIQLARGYLNRPALTAERFVPDPFGKPGSRMYATGDLGRWRNDGQIEYLGRRDQQLKIRGFRIEPGEIERALKECDGVEDAAVVGFENGQGEKELIAYVAGRHAPSVEALRQRLQQELPAYMVPAGWVNLERLPLSPSGKLDRKALPAPQNGRGHLGTQYVAPRNPTEQTLADIWCDVLNVPRVGIHDNFFTLGGHSLTAVKVASRINEAFDIRMRLRQFYLYPTIGEQASHVLLCVIGAQDTSEPLEPVEQGRNLSLIPWLTADEPLPPTSRALLADTGTPGLLAAEGGLALRRLKEAAANGIFPMPTPGQPLLWWAPELRMVLHTREFHVSRSLRRSMRRFFAESGNEVRVDTAFRQVVDACGSVARNYGTGSTWISPELAEQYELWHREGGAHSFELWSDGELIGGVFCLAIGRMIYAESMFGYRTDASKIVLASLVAFCLDHGVPLIDCQMRTDHLASLGGREIPRADFEAHLLQARELPPIGDWRFDRGAWKHLLITEADIRAAD
jgi:leucyl/phenylalanyl-tRNA--protein transferase